MRTIWLNGLQRPHLGQDFTSLISTLIAAGIKGGVDWYGAKQASDAAKKTQQAAAAQAQAAQAAAAAAQAKQQAAEAMQQAAATPVGGGGTAANQIVPGVSNSAIYIGAGLLGVGILVVAFAATRRGASEEPAKNGKKK